MGILTDDMKRVVNEQKLGFYATVCPDGTPNLSPKGTTVVWDDDHIAFCNIRSPQTVRNLEANPAIEINLVDPVARKGYRFKGVARIVREGDIFERVRGMFSDNAATRTSAVVVIEVQKAQPLTSPAYDWGTTEEELRSIFKQRLVELYGPF